MGDFGQLVAGLTAFGWLALFASALYYFAPQIQEILISIARQISSGARIKYAGLDFIGVNVFERSAEELRGNRVEKSPADKIRFEDRDQVYRRNRNFFLVHKIRNSAEIGTRNAQGKRFDIELSLHSHKGYGGLGEIQYVEYYFGVFFGDQPYGSCYRVNEAAGGFAVVTAAYGEFLCRAKVHFRDGTEVHFDRYVDFAMAGVLPPADQTSVLGRSK